MKIIRNILIVLFLLVIAGAILFYIYDEPKPTGKSGLKAEQLANKMLLSLNKDAWEQTKWLSFRAMGDHRYIWNKENEKILVRWKKNTVLLDTRTYEGIAYQDTIKAEGEDKQELIKTAREFYSNDPFWLIAPFKIKDPGTTLKYTEINDTLEGLIVEYTQGGVTPGDTYLWAINPEGIPRYWKMWVSIIPIGGLKATWRDWEKISTGAKISTNKNIGPFTLSFTKLKTGDSYRDLGLKENPFKEFE